AGGTTPSGKPGSVVAFDPGSGAIKWQRFPAGYVLPGMPAIGDILIVATTAHGNASNVLDILDAHTGALLKSFPGSQALWAATSVAGGRIYYTNPAGHLVALGVPGDLGDGGTADGGTDAGTSDAGASDGGTSGGGTSDGGTSD